MQPSLQAPPPPHGRPIHIDTSAAAAAPLPLPEVRLRFSGRNQVVANCTKAKFQAEAMAAQPARLTMTQPARPHTLALSGVQGGITSSAELTLRYLRTKRDQMWIDFECTKRGRSVSWHGCPGAAGF